MAGEVSKEELLRAQTRVWNYAFGCIRSLSVMVAVQLRIPDAIHAHAGPIPLPDLASAVGIPERNVPALRRLMRALSNAGVFDRNVVKTSGEEGREAQKEEEAYLPTLFSTQLVRDHPTTAASFLLKGVYPLLVTPWYSMAAWFRGEGRQAATGFEVAHGENIWQSLGRVPEFNDVLNDAMACDARWSVTLVAREHPEVFRGLASLVDVGGGSGASAKAVKEAFPEMKCTVLDLPHVVAASPAIDGVDLVEGDMFEHIPPADAVLLKWVLHDWSNDDCVRILRRCKEAIPEKGGKVIIIEMVIGSSGCGGGHGRDHDRELVEAQDLFDLHMLAVTSGKERDEAEWRHLFTAASFSGCKITPTLGPRAIMEVYP